MVGFVHFSNFFIPSEKYYSLISVLLDHPVTSLPSPIVRKQYKPLAPLHRVG